MKCPNCKCELELILNIKGDTTALSVDVEKMKVCGNSNIRNLTDEERERGRSHRCTQDDPCDRCKKSSQSQLDKCRV